jgi:transcriptional regulator GlxA family with amidase domain
MMTQQSTISATILVLPESSMMTLSSVIDPLRAANRLSRLPLYSWQLVSLNGEAVTLTCGIEIKVDGALSDKASGELLIVVAGFNYHRYASPKTLVTLRLAAKKFNKIFAIEAGTWVLARAGVITHHQVTTHWEDIENLANAFPSLDVGDERFIIDQNIWSSGGASPALDMMLHYLATTQNRSLALDVASVFIYDQSRAPTDAQTIVSLGRIETLEPRLGKCVRIMETNIEEPLSIKEIADRLMLSTKTLETLCHRHLGETPGTYYLRLRLQIARRLVLDTSLTMMEVSVRSGFNSSAAFTRAFSRRYNRNPLKLRKESL